MRSTRGAQPLAIRCHRPFVPHTHERRPLRPHIREAMHGPIESELVTFGRRIPSGRLCVGIAIVALLVFVVPVLVRAL